MATIEISVIVPATDRPATLARCLAALEGGRRRPDELIVVAEPRMAGPSEARNRGAEIARGDLLVFVDADVEVHADALARIEEVLREQPSLDAVFGSYDDDPQAPGSVSRFRNLLHHHVHSGAAGAAETFWAGLGAIRREAFLGAGGFDAQRFGAPSIEDVELGARLHAGGASLALDPSIQGAHLKRWSLRSMIATDLWRRGAPWVELQVRTRRPGGGSLNAGPRHLLSAIAALATVHAIARRRPLSAAAAALSNFAIHPSLYALLHRRGGLRLLAIAPALHVIHSLSAIASVPVGIWRGLRAHPGMGAR